MNYNETEYTYVVHFLNYSFWLPSGSSLYRKVEIFQERLNIALYGGEYF